MKGGMPPKSLNLIVPALRHFIRIELSVVGIWALSRIRSLVLGYSSAEKCLACKALGSMPSTTKQ